MHLLTYRHTALLERTMVLSVGLVLSEGIRFALVTHISLKYFPHLDQSQRLLSLCGSVPDRTESDALL